MDNEGYVTIEVVAVLDTFLEEPQSFVHEWSGKVFFNSAAGAEQQIGSCAVIYVDVIGAINRHMSLFNVFDTMQTTCDYLQLYDDDFNFSSRVCKASGLDEASWNPNLLILDRLIINPDFRGRDIGLTALCALMHRFKLGAGMIALKPFPLQLESAYQGSNKVEERKQLGFDDFPQNKRTATAKLKKYYSKLGFKSVPKTDYMVLNPDTPFPHLNF